MIKKIIFHFLRLTIAKKMLLGYLTLVVLFFLISAFSISSLERLNNINRVIISLDVPLVETADNLVDALISQELYARRYAILKSPEMLNLSREKSKELDKLVEKLRSLPSTEDIPIERISTLHSEYQALFIGGIEYFRDPSSPSAKKYDSAIKKKQEELIGLIKEVSSRARKDQNEKTFMSSRIGISAFRITLFLCIISIILSIGATVLITRSIALPISHLKFATQNISEGKFDLISEVKNKDEIGDLSNAFNEMTRRLKRLEEMYLDANPITKLPGSIAIQNVLNKRIESNSPLALCYIDLDNFKVFNDKYGYARGNQVIIATSKIIENCVIEVGTSDDFVGHVGGDDFVLITTPENFRKSCNYIVEAFDNTIPNFYDPSDLNRGFITGKTRQGLELQFTTMSISIAVVTNLVRKLTNAIEVGEIAAELKKYAKTIRGSIYVVDRRRKDTTEGTDSSV